jgi:hypothetical protein
MDTSTTQNIIAEAYKKAPVYIQNFVTSGKLDLLATSLHEKLALHLDELAQLQQELLFAVLGITPLSELPQTLEDEIGLTPEQVDEILGEVNTQILEPLRNELKEKTAVKEPARAVSPSQVVPPKPVAITSPVVAKAPTQANVKALEVMPPHEITVRTMKNDVVSVKAGEKPSRFVMPLIKKEVASAAANPVSKYLKPLGAASPIASDTTPKPAFSSRFAGAPSEPKPSEPVKTSSLPPQTFLPIKAKEPVLKIDPLKTVDNTGTSFIPKSPVVAPTLVNSASAPIPSTAPAPKPTVPMPTPPKPATPPASAKRIDPYREIPE